MSHTYFERERCNGVCGVHGLFEISADGKVGEFSLASPVFCLYDPSL